MISICTRCGDFIYDSNTKVCKLGHFSWLHISDFDSKDLQMKSLCYEVATRFGFSIEELKATMLNDIPIQILLATYYSHWSNGASLRSYCKFNPITKRVFKIEPINCKVNANFVGESVELPNGTILTETEGVKFP